ncbi:polysaccharide pyruvyl transferase family protein [Xylanimonas cellulosilytica]|nr:polysaccharide pyruvyl transferase family protein [Xylanimonas cellulosilytica]
MMKQIAILHGYSATNKGDGLLVDLAIEMARRAVGEDAQITLAANHPQTFAGVVGTVIDSAPRTAGGIREYLNFLATLSRFDLVLGVGGGYLRFGNMESAVKAAIVHLPQLAAASRAKTTTAYLPQSIGPLRWPARAVVRVLLRRIDVVWLRDDRSMGELDLPNTRRSVDLALGKIAAQRGARLGFESSDLPVLSVRYVDHEITDPLLAFSNLLRPFEGYVQSTAGANDDRPATSATSPTRVLSREQLITSPSRRRVVVAVRMHAALMALAAGHYVVHLAYERKGFAAFRDLGLPEYVHNVRTFDPKLVYRQVEELRQSSVARRNYDESIARSTVSRTDAMESVEADLRQRLRRTELGDDLG